MAKMQRRVKSEMETVARGLASVACGLTSASNFRDCAGSSFLAAADRRKNTDTFAAIQGLIQIRFNAVDKYQSGLGRWDIQFIQQTLNGGAGFDGEIVC